MVLKTLNTAENEFYFHLIQYWVMHDKNRALYIVQHKLSSKQCTIASTQWQSHDSALLFR